MAGRVYRRFRKSTGSSPVSSLGRLATVCRLKLFLFY
uniref:Uncharacterized protein n=2 Tax=unclassified Caudoviricetes TaxID=2788787 RepID=A0A8S5QBQ8_9CAUD|nr:MAG TPA: hypothetical protein [Siphoviridae sp. ctQWG7]DAE16750.1 MAG TPA: hypothetical protein [Siphoviridae sp. ct8Hy2]